MEIQWQYKWVRGVVYVLGHYGMTVWGRVLHQEPWYIVDDYVIYSALHWAKQVMVKVGYLYGLVDNEMV